MPGAPICCAQGAIFLLRKLKLIVTPCLRGFSSAPAPSPAAGAGVAGA